MKSIIMFAIGIVGFSQLAFAGPTIFGLELGVTTKTEAMEKYDATLEGVNRYTNLNLYTFDVSDIDFDGLKSMVVQFDENDELVSVFTTIQKSRFNYLENILSEKYTVVSRTVPPVGNKLVEYSDGDYVITAMAQHMSFDMNLVYMSVEIRDTIQEAIRAERQQQLNNDASNF